MSALIRLWVAFFLLHTSFGLTLNAADVGEAKGVAAKLEKSRFQKWPRVAWAEEANCWLVVWREGDLNEQKTDIWCARVGADGTALDPEGILISSAKDVQDHPVLASNGKDFMIVWQDLRSGTDWDVYSARVSGSGKLLDSESVLVSGGPHNQCIPSLVCTGEGYYIAWQSWVKDGAYKDYGSYEVRGARISASGELLDPKGIDLIGSTAVLPALAFHKDAGLALMVIGRSRKTMSPNSFFFNKPGIIRIDLKTGQAEGGVTYFPKNKTTWDTNYTPGIILLKDGTGMVTMNGWKGGMTFFRFDQKGKRLGDWQTFRHNLRNQSIAPMSSIALGEGRALMTYDFPSASDKMNMKKIIRMIVWGWMLSPEGVITDGGEFGFSISASKTTDSMQAVSCAGPKGTFLVVYSEARAIENTKVTARIVK